MERLRIMEKRHEIMIFYELCWKFPPYYIFKCQKLLTVNSLPCKIIEKQAFREGIDDCLARLPTIINNGEYYFIKRQRTWKIIRGR